MIAILFISLIGASITAVLMALLEEEHQKLLTWLAGGFGLITVISLIGIVATTETPVIARPSYEPPAQITNNSRSDDSPHEARYTSHSDPTFTMSSDGNTWNRASDAEKRELARKLSANSKNGNSAAYFYSGMNTFYKDSNSDIKSTPLKDMTDMFENASRIPIEQLNRLPESAIEDIKRKRRNNQ